MSRYQEKPFPLEGLKTYSISQRKSKVTITDFARVSASASFQDFWDGLPNILAGADLRRLVELLQTAKASQKPILWGCGGHVVKVGLAPVLISLMKAGWVQGLAMNGACAIHDYEIALTGKTSEDVAAELGSGSFGMAEETGSGINRLLQKGWQEGIGAGEAIGRGLHEMGAPFGERSLLCEAYRLAIPVTIHIAVGTDIIHNHPECRGEALGACSHYDFRLFASLVAGMNKGGAYLNFGSAVLLPEVFLKAISLVRNRQPLEGFVTANFDFIQHYRPTQNVVRRPVMSGGHGFAFTGHHEIMLPLLATALLNCPINTETQR